MKIISYVILALLQCGLLHAEVIQATVKVKNFREIYVSYSDIMGVSANDATLKAIFNDVKERLPKKGLSQEFNSPAIMAMTELSGAFCQIALNREKSQSSGERILFSNVDFAKPPKQISDYSLETTSRRLSKLFWQREIRPEEIVAIQKLFNEMSKDNLENVDTTAKAMHSVCISFSTSLAFITKN